MTSTTGSLADIERAETDRVEALRHVGMARLASFVGTWTTEGEQHESSVGPAAAIAAVQTYEWLPGEKFLVHRFNGRVGASDASCIEIVGYDVETDRFAVHTYYNSGVTNEWRLQERAGLWLLTGEWTEKGTTRHVRCATTFHDDGARVDARWEQSLDGARWQPFWTLTATRVS